LRLGSNIRMRIEELSEKGKRLEGRGTIIVRQDPEPGQTGKIFDRITG